MDEQPDDVKSLRVAHGRYRSTLRQLLRSAEKPFRLNPLASNVGDEMQARLAAESMLEGPLRSTLDRLEVAFARSAMHERFNSQSVAGGGWEATAIKTITWTFASKVTVERYLTEQNHGQMCAVLALLDLADQLQHT